MANNQQPRQQYDPLIPPINLSMREMTTQQQLTSLLGVASFMWSALHRPQHPFGETETTGPETRLHSEVTVAAQSSFIKACAAIDLIVEDVKRWDTKFQEKIEADYNEGMKMNLEYMRAQRDAMKEVAAPHHSIQPQLGKLGDGSWIAFIGDLSNPEAVVAGNGNSPQEAYDAFDIAFKSATGKHNSKNEQNTKSVDRPANSDPSQPPKKWHKRYGDSPSSGQGPADGGEENSGAGVS